MWNGLRVTAILPALCRILIIWCNLEALRCQRTVAAFHHPSLLIWFPGSVIQPYLKINVIFVFILLEEGIFLDCDYEWVNNLYPHVHIAKYLQGDCNSLQFRIQIHLMHFFFLLSINHYIICCVWYLNSEGSLHWSNNSHNLISVIFVVQDLHLC